MSEINPLSRVSGSYGTAAVRALDKSQPTVSQQEKAREARTAELKQRYQSGQYQVDSVELSSAVVASLLKNDR